MRNLSIVVLAGWLWACADNRAQSHPMCEESCLDETLPMSRIELLPDTAAADAPAADAAVAKAVAYALVCQLWENMDRNKYVIKSVADALEKIGENAGDALAEAVFRGFGGAKCAGTAKDQKAALGVAKQAAMILGRIGTKVAGKQYVVIQLIYAAENCAKVCVGDENRVELREARGAAIEALGRIFIKRAGEMRHAKESRKIAIFALAGLLMNCDFAIKIRSAEALANIYGEPEK
jgi:hypothetical protein